MGVLTQPGPPLENTIALVVPLVGARFLFILCRVLEVRSKNGPSVQAQPGSIAQLLRGQTWIPPTPRNHSNRLWAADEGCASAPVRHMVYDGKSAKDVTLFVCVKLKNYLSDHYNIFTHYKKYSWECIETFSEKYVHSPSLEMFCVYLLPAYMVVLVEFL